MFYFVCLELHNFSKHFQKFFTMLNELSKKLWSVHIKGYYSYSSIREKQNHVIHRKMDVHPQKNG